MRLCTASQRRLQRNPRHCKRWSVFPYGLMALAAGTRIGPYEVTGSIGAGGMGEVYRATDTNLKRAVAIKVLPESVAADAERLAARG